MNSIVSDHASAERIKIATMWKMSPTSPVFASALGYALENLGYPWLDRTSFHVLQIWLVQYEIVVTFLRRAGLGGTYPRGNLAGRWLDLELDPCFGKKLSSASQTNPNRSCS
jgi:hypothetical protein